MFAGNRARIQVKRSLNYFKCHGLARGYLLFAYGVVSLTDQLRDLRNGKRSRSEEDKH